MTCCLRGGSGSPEMPPETDLFLNPYNKASPHHRPIGTGAVYAGDDHASSLDWRKQNFTTASVGFPNGVWFTKNSATDPIVTVQQQVSGKPGVPCQIRLPLSIRGRPRPPNEGNYYDNTLWVYNGAGGGNVEQGFLHGFYEFVWSSGTTAEARYRKAVDAKGTGIGPTHIGPSASGMTTLIGLQRGFELNDAGTGEILHVTNFIAPAQPSSGFPIVTANWHVWPAVSTDGHCNGTTTCTGNVPYGALMALPQKIYTDSVLNTLGLSPLGMRLARQLRNFGGYLMDGGGGRATRIDQVVIAATRIEFNEQMRKVYPRLRMVMNNLSTQQVAGGGQALAPNSAFDA